MRKFMLFSLAAVLLLSLTESCGNDTEDKEKLVAGQTDSVQQAVEQGNQQLGKSTMIKYSGAADDQVHKSLTTYAPFTHVWALTNLTISIKDSLQHLYMNDQSKTVDSSLFLQNERKAYQAILDYQQLLISNPPLSDNTATLLQLNRSLDDSLLSLLPSPGKSTLLSNNAFFFLGGAPFIFKLEPEKNTVFKDPQGNPELHFGVTMTENTSYLLSMIAHFKNGPMKVTFGPPLQSYDSGPRDVHGIGSLIHEFVNPLPVLFLTESGIVTGRLLTITLNLAPEELCYASDQPFIVFSCPKIIKQEDIVGIYIPFDLNPIHTFKLNRSANNIWTADLNNDGIPELACISDTFTGATQDALASVLWFVNINGSWKIIDWGEDLDCT